MSFIYYIAWIGKIILKGGQACFSPSVPENAS